MNDHTPVSISMVDRVNAAKLLARAADEIHDDESMEESASEIQAAIAVLDDIVQPRSVILSIADAQKIHFALLLAGGILDRNTRRNAVDDPAGLARDIAERLDTLTIEKRNNP